MKDEDKGILTGICFTLVIIGMFNLPSLILGDSNDDIYPHHIEQGQKVCEPNEGLKKIEGETFSQHFLICNNGAVFSYVPQKRNIEQEVKTWKGDE